MNGGKGRICHRNAPLPESHHLKTDSALSRSKSVRKEDDLLQELPSRQEIQCHGHQPTRKKYTGRGVLHRGLDICLKTPFYLANRLWMRRQTSSTFSRELNAEMRKNPSPLEPKPEPGVITTFASCSILSNICQLSRPSGHCTHT